MEVRHTRRKQMSKHEAKVKNREGVGASPLTSDQQYLQVSGSSLVRRVVTRLKESALFSWLRDAIMTLKQSIMGNESWTVVLVQIGLWLLLLWLLSNLHMGLPCFLLALVFWLYNIYGGGGGGGAALTTTLTVRHEE
ncbi:hypothetical protein KOW79_008654 [Hemibagrus wyckioides]|uniref:SAYSvFN domain-containing protein n=1 Tax=Hemibagrus wyckioides TaxID=337641 RepID=A0A9D3NWZ7_9TELE|nr:hypothetical protein KOW79_008654 [Hemibagrus wyckioides]